MEWKDIFLILVVLMCPLMHFVMMRGMHKNNHQMKDGNNNDKKQHDKSCH